MSDPIPQPADDLVCFMSEPVYFDKEFDGRKPNTVRECKPGDERFVRLRSGIAKRIRITNTKTGASFERKITDVSFWKNICDVSWKHEDTPLVESDYA